MYYGMKAVNVCKLNSTVCNSKQIWNSDTCRCDCNEDFAGIISCDKGYTWNPSTCECQCDMCCKPGQYLDHKSCVCKNKLVGRVIEEWTSIINETMINNKDSLTVCFYHVTYAFQSESTLCSCLNVKELLARSRREI